MKRRPNLGFSVSQFLRLRILTKMCDSFLGNSWGALSSYHNKEFEFDVLKFRFNLIALKKQRIKKCSFLNYEM